MAIRLAGLRWLALDPEAQARFWAELLGLPAAGARVAAPGFALEFVATDRPKTRQGRIHLDLTSTSPQDQRAQVATVLRLAGTGRIGAVNCDGTHALGVFWSRALAWPLVWDEGEETAIQSPEGGSKLTWSGPPLMVGDAPPRISLHVTAQGPGDLARLVALGATALDGGGLLDPDGNEVAVTGEDPQLPSPWARRR